MFSELCVSEACVRTIIRDERFRRSEGGGEWNFVVKCRVAKTLTGLGEMLFVLLLIVFWKRKPPGFF